MSSSCANVTPRNMIMDQEHIHDETNDARKQPKRAAPAKRVLTLDAGGVRSLSMLKTLRALFENIAQSRSGDAGCLPKPCEHFDLICGSEWGAVLALMLGRLQMVL